MAFSIPHSVLRVSIRQVLNQPQTLRHRPAQAFAPLVSCAGASWPAIRLKSPPVHPNSVSEITSECSPAIVASHPRSVQCSAIRTDTEEVVDTEAPYEGPMQVTS